VNRVGFALFADVYGEDIGSREAVFTSAKIGCLGPTLPLGLCLILGLGLGLCCRRYSAGLAADLIGVSRHATQVRGPKREFVEPASTL
jgi:hypothetical protein